MAENEFGDFLRALRLARNLSQERLGELAEVDPGTISRWERGARVPQRGDSFDTVRRVGEKLRDNGRLLELAGFTDRDDKRIVKGRPPFRDLILSEKTLKPRQRRFLLEVYESLLSDDGPV